MSAGLTPSLGLRFFHPGLRPPWRWQRSGFRDTADPPQPASSQRHPPPWAMHVVAGCLGGAMHVVAGYLGGAMHVVDGCLGGG